MSQETPRLDFDALIDAYFDDVLTDEQMEQLQAELIASPEKAVLFARRAQDHQHLQKLFSGDRVFYLAERIGAAQEEDTFSIDQLALLEDNNEDTPLVDLTERLDRERREKNRAGLRLADATANEHPRRVIVIPPSAIWLAVAAVLGLMAWVGVEHFRQSDQRQKPDVVEAVPQPSPPAPPPARLLAAHRAQWSAGSDPVGPDGAVPTGKYQLDAGYIQLAMADGAEVIVQGPATLTIRTGGRVTLSAGALSAYVPEGAEGFVVDTPAGRVLDLGTEFGVEVIDEKAVEVHVLTGRVVASLPDQGAMRMIEAGDAGRMDTNTDEIEPVNVDASRFARDWEEVERSVRVEGAVRYLYNTPTSVEPSVLENDDLLFLLPEQRGVQVPAAQVLCDFIAPGQYDRLSVDAQTITGEQSVDSYLLHYDRAGIPDELDLAYAEGVIHFDRPIVGIIAGNNKLYASDALFAAPDVAYPTPTVIGRGFEGFNHSGFVQDQIEISEDRRTLKVRLGASINIDQLRVLVQAAEPELGAGTNQTFYEAGVALDSFSYHSTEDLR